MPTRYLHGSMCLMLVLMSNWVCAAAPQRAVGIQDEVQVVRLSSTEYRLNPNDVFDLDFRFTPELNQVVTVRPDGFITLQGVGDVQAAGLTVVELTRAIERAYASLLRDPLISVSLKDFRKPYITVDGEVGKPGQYELRGIMTLTEAIAIAGGFTQHAKHSEVWLFHRPQDGPMRARLFNVKRMQNSGDLTEDPRVYPSDMIFVPKGIMSKIQRFSPMSWISLWLLWR